MFEWNDITPEESQKPRSMLPIINLVWQYQNQMKELILEHTGRNVYLYPVDTSAGIRNIPFTKMINNIEENLRNLAGTEFPIETIINIVWRGGLADDRRLDYRDVNRWFNNLFALYRYVLAYSQNFLISGEFHAADDALDYQILGID